MQLHNFSEPQVPNLQNGIRIKWSNMHYASTPIADITEKVLNNGTYYYVLGGNV